MIVRRVHERRGWLWWVAVPVVRTSLTLTTRPRWIDGERIPAQGGCVVVANHVSEVDPLILAHMLYNHGRVPHYLAKSGLFAHRALGYVMRNLGQIPVFRATRDARGAYSAAVDAVRRGQLVVVYPEGTITRDPGLWPMAGKSGAARIALETGCPVVPIGQWGAQRLLAPYARRPHLLPRSVVELRVGEPVDLGDLAEGAVSASSIAEATTRIMDAITALVQEIRGEPAPAERFDLRARDHQDHQDHQDHRVDGAGEERGA